MLPKLRVDLKELCCFTNEPQEYVAERFYSLGAHVTPAAELTCKYKESYMYKRFRERYCE